MITEEQYQESRRAEQAARTTIAEYHQEKADAFKERMATNPIFTVDELFFSAGARCPCGDGLAYPKDCGPHHYWDCSAILMGTATNVQHTAKLPFTTYDVKGESEHRGTTRPPKEQLYHHFEIGKRITNPSYHPTQGEQGNV